MTKPYQKYLFVDFITDEQFKEWVIAPTPESEYYWKSWLESHPEKAETVAAAREFILSVKIQKQQPSSRKAEIYQQVIADSKKSDGEIPRSRMRIQFLYRVAASVIIVLGLAWVAYNLRTETSVEEQQLVEIYETKSTKKGEKLTVMLPDGTLVKLNAESSIKYPATFGSQREVMLTGEAFFEVARDTAKPFTVATKHLLTTALGTSFNINAYGNQEEVILVTGKVRINDNVSSQSEILLPGEMVAFESGAIKKTTNASLESIRWKEGILIFKETPLQRGIAELERWYGVTVELKNLRNTDVFLTGYFDNQNLKNVLESLSYTARFDYHIEGKKVLIIFIK